MLSKKLIRLFINKRNVRFDDILIGLGLFIRTSDGHIVPESGKSSALIFKELDEIFYTLDYLINNKFIELTNGSGLTGVSLYGLNLRNQSHVSHAIYLQDLLEKHLGNTYIIKVSIFDFERNGYRTAKEREDSRRYWEAVGIAIITAICTSIFTSIFS